MKGKVEQPKETPSPKDPVREAQSLKDRIAHMTKILPSMEEKVKKSWDTYCSDQDNLEAFKEKMVENQKLLNSLSVTDPPNVVSFNHKFVMITCD